MLLAVDRAFFDALRAQAVAAVAQQTVAARQVVVDQVSALASTGLKSTLDLSFAQVSLSEARLLLVQARQRRAGRVRRAVERRWAHRSATTYDLIGRALPDVANFRSRRPHRTRVCRPA